MSNVVQISIPADDKGYPEINLEFRKPTVPEIGALLSGRSKSNNLLKENIKFLRTVFVSGDEWVFDDAILLYGICDKLQDLLNGYPINIHNEFNATTKIMEFTITIEVNQADEANPVFKIRRPNVEQLTGWNNYIGSNDLIALKELLQACWLEGDKSILENADYLLSAYSAQESIFNVRLDNIVKTWLQPK